MHNIVVTVAVLALIGLPAYVATGQEVEDAVDGAIVGGAIGAVAGEDGKRGDAAAKPEEGQEQTDYGAEERPDDQRV